MKPVALVTGAARGIGLGIAECLGNAGFDLVICATRPADAVQASIDRLNATGADTHYCQCDVSDREARARMIDSARERFARLDVLVNNAGVAPSVRSDLLDATEESYDRVMGINLKGPYFLTQQVARWMVEQRGASPDSFFCIVNITSISSTVASPNRGEYCLSKAALSMASMLYAARLAEHDIPVYEVRPGIIETDMTAGVKEKYDRLLAEGLAPQKRWGRPDDIGKAVVALATGALPYSTGEVIMVDGGLTLQRL